MATQPAVRPPNFRKFFENETAANDTAFGGDPFGAPGQTPQIPQQGQQPVLNLGQTQLLGQQAVQTAGQQLAGQVPGFQEQAGEAREATRAAQAETGRLTREALTGAGLRDTGAFVEEGLIGTAQARERGLTALERGLAAERGRLGLQAQQAGLQAATTLTGQAQQGQQFQQEVDLRKQELFGGTDPNTGEFVPGAMQLARDQFGLQSDQLDMQKQELFGFTDPVTGQRVEGKINLLNAADAREAESLYGYTDPDTGMQIKGDLELKNDQVAIQAQGMGLEEAKVFGYTDAQGNFVPGELQNEAAKLGLEAQTLDLQEKELFGGTLPDGTVVQGKYDLLSNEQKLKADQLYGYYDANGNWTPGAFHQEMIFAEMDKALAERGQDLASFMPFLETLPFEQAFSVLDSMATSLGLELPPVDPARTAEMELEPINAKLASGDRLNNEEMAALRVAVEAGDIAIPSIDNTPIRVDQMAVETEAARGYERLGEDAWRFSEAAWNWLNANADPETGTIVQSKNGDFYRVTGFDEANRNEEWEAFITLENIATGEVITQKRTEEENLDF